MADDWRTPETDALIDALLRLEDADEAGRFLRDLCTLGELRDLAQRWAVVRLLDGDALRRDLARDRRQHGDDHPHRLLAQSRRGRLPADARAHPGRRPGRDGRCRGLDPHRTPGDEGAPPAGGPQQGPPRRADARPCSTTPASCSRSTTAASSPRVQNHQLDILFVRTADVIEFVGDGVADLGITGGDLLAETGAELPVVRELGYGRCRLAAAVPSDSPYGSIADLAGAARRDVPPQRHPTVLRRPVASPSTSSRSRARSRSPRASASPRRSWISSPPARRWR